MPVLYRNMKLSLDIICCEPGIASKQIYIGHVFMSMFFSVCTIVHQEFQLQHPWIFSILAMLNASTPLQGSAPREPANVSDSSEMHDNWKLLRLMSPSKSKLGSEWLGIQRPCFHCAFRWDYDYWLRPIYILSGALSAKQIRQIRPEDSVLTCVQASPSFPANLPCLHLKAEVGHGAVDNSNDIRERTTGQFCLLLQ